MLDWKKKLKFIAITSAFAILILIVLTNVVKMTQVSEKDFRTYEQGLYFLNQNDYQNAFYNFSNVSKNSAIYEIALLRQAICADEIKDSETASKRYRLFIEKYPDSMFIQKVYYALAQNYFRANDYPKAEKTFNEIKRNFKDTEYSTAANYYLGLIHKDKDKTKAKNSFIEYLKEAPDGRYAISSVNEILNLKEELNQNDYYLIGRAYTKNGNYKTALDYLNKSYMSSSWGYIALDDIKTGEYQKSREIFENGYAKYSYSVAEKDIRTFIDTYVFNYPDGIKKGLYKALEIANNNNSKGADYILYLLTKYESNENKLKIYNEIFQKYPKGDYAADALSNLFWNAYKSRNYTQAMQLGQIHLRDYQNTISSPKVMFWMGRIAEKQGLRNEAKGFYQRLLEKYPDDYYAYRAAKKLSFTTGSGWKTKTSHRLPENDKVILFPIKHTKISDDNMTLVNTIIKLKDFSLLGEIEKDNKSIQSWLMYKNGKYATSATLARDAISEMETKPSFSDALYKLAYQLHYQENINNYSKYYSLDPYLVAALIREESYYNPKAGSSVGAMGLMQLMPATASYIASKKGIQYTGSASLFNPETNIELGCAYLNYAKQKLHNNDLLAVASYNGGPNAVRNWHENLNYDNFDEFIENIPYPETKEYVKKVYRSYWVYLNVY